MKTISDEDNYGYEDSSFQAAGAERGIKKLAYDFYDIMSSESEFKIIYEMHSRDINESIDRLARFLCGWMGGPRLYQKHYGSIHIPYAHQHLNIGDQERDLWLRCMEKALALQPYKKSFKKYLLAQFKIPAEVIQKQCSFPHTGKRE